MTNYEQQRAHDAYEAADGEKSNRFIGKGGSKKVVSKVASMILANGFIGAMAFAISNERQGHEAVFEAILDHLKNSNRNYEIDTGNCRNFLKGISDIRVPADVLRAVTDESLAYLNYLRRFAKPGKDEEDEE